METAQEVSIKKQTKEIHEPPIIGDPWELMAQFYESQRYKDALKSFYVGKNISPEVFEKEKERVFLENGAARNALIDFGTKNVLFKYDRSKYPKRSLEALDNYVKAVKDLEKMDRGTRTREELAAMDEFRVVSHQQAAQAVVREGIAPSTACGEAMARLVLIDKGLDAPEAAKKESTKEKLKRKLGSY